jgi:UBA/TS-N domain
MVQQFESMGFNRNAILAALLHTGNDFEAALNALLRGEFANAGPQPEPGENCQQIDTVTELPAEVEIVKTDIKQEKINPVDHLQYLELYCNQDSALW